ncbi:MAG: LPS assembly lipoprotein LptE [Pseudomonadota bacterium]
MLKNRRLLFTALASTVMLSACGFKLRGSVLGENLPFKSIFITPPDAANYSANASLGAQLRRYIRGSGELELKTSQKEAEVTLDLMSEVRNKVILSLNSQGRVREYMLYYNVTYRVLDSKGLVLMEPTLLTLKRDMSYNESQALAKEAEEAMLYRDMQSDAVQQILRRLAGVKLVDNGPAEK